MTHIWRRGNGEQHRSVLSIDQSLALLAIGIVYAHCQIYLKYLVNVSVRVLRVYDLVLRTGYANHSDLLKKKPFVSGVRAKYSQMWQNWKTMLRLWSILIWLKKRLAKSQLRLYFHCPPLWIKPGKEESYDWPWFALTTHHCKQLMISQPFWMMNLAKAQLESKEPSAMP